MTSHRTTVARSCGTRLAPGNGKAEQVFMECDHLGVPGVVGAAADAQHGVVRETDGGGDRTEVTAAAVQRFDHLGQKVGLLMHPPTLGKSALLVKTNLPWNSRDDRGMGKPPSKVLQVLAENLKRCIADHKELNTEPKLAARAKMDQKTVYRITHLQNEPSIDKVERLAKALGVEAWQLLVPALTLAEPPEIAVKEKAEA